MYAREIEPARAPGAEAQGYLPAEWNHPLPVDPHTRFATIYTSKAQGAPGIIPVFTAEDFARLFEPLKTTSQMGDKPELLPAERVGMAHSSETSRIL